MKGIVFNILERVVTDTHGADTWDTLLDRSGASGVYSALGSYPDAELIGLVVAASELTGASPGDVLRWFGTEAIAIFHARYPELFAGHSHSTALLARLNDVIHPEVRKLYPGAEVPEFDFELGGRESIVIIYRSSKRLCALAEGLIQGTARMYGESVTIAHPRCLLRSDESCRLECAFLSLAATP